MRNSVLLLLLLAAPLGAADRGIQRTLGYRSDPKEPRHRAWWLEVTGAGTQEIKGRFVGFPGGDMNDIPKIWIDNGEPAFHLRPLGRRRVHQEYRR